jgi:predicted metal-dependent peptidase
VPLAATNGKKIFFNPITYLELPPSERDGVYLHELLHMALLHNLRRGVRNQRVFNIAADIVVNGMIENEGICKIPSFGIRDKKLEKFSVEEVYEMINKNNKEYQLNFIDLIENKKEFDNSNQNKVNNMDNTESGEIGISDLNSEADIRAYWKQAISDAKIISKNSGNISTADSFTRHLGEILEPEIDWKAKLWNFLVRTPTDFGGFDRRLIHSGIYLENLEGESINVFCCIDTSGSILDKEIDKFMSEVKGIMDSYPNLNCKIWYADHHCYGPYEIKSTSNIPKPIGGGGTNFAPFFNHILKDKYGKNEAVCIYLTDGYGEFPSKKPDLPVLWVIVPGGASNEFFPFGEVVRLNS